ncbi:2-iminobutanoate/2-iminopropanoate deaminase [Coccinella septempunctata]|uniref:2-iminobutanoate/2-iminopropanoate deaminase n=1 Tax=Coccinella septempunctata TaxID=41139 RepID=UPI001D079A84|nr:2-iminobutanoate/2-iminopropanoate deaminase [Coccinella septempunctata]
MLNRQLLSGIYRRGDDLIQRFVFDKRNLQFRKHYSNVTSVTSISRENCVNRGANFDITCRPLMASPQNKAKNKQEPTVRKVILTQCAPKPVGPYSQAVQFGNTLYVSGVLGLDKNKMELVEGGVAGQAKQALTNLGHILKAAGTTYENVIKTSIFLANIGDFKEVNDIYKDFFLSNPPARSTYQVAALPLGALVEIEVIAGTGEIEQASCNCGSKI